MKATTKYGSELRTWDEGFDDSPLFVYLNSLGPAGVVRAPTWEEAWECTVDEIMPDADPSDPDSYARSYDETAAEGDLAEGVYHRSSGTPSNDGLTSPLAQDDLNGSRLVQVTLDHLRDEYGITVTWEES